MLPGKSFEPFVMFSNGKISVIYNSTFNFVFCNICARDEGDFLNFIRYAIRCSLYQKKCPRARQDITSSQWTMRAT